MGKRRTSVDKKIGQLATGNRDRQKTNRTRESTLRKLGVRSGLEERVKKQLEDNKVIYEYESVSIPFTVPSLVRHYTPDFLLDTKSGKHIYVETKGRWEYDDRYKHLLIKQQHPDLDIRFVFSNANARVRKGSPTTYRDICEGRGRGIWKGVTWKYAEKLIPQEWLEE